MSIIVRGVKNAFRNAIRTFSVTVILGISVSLALVMLLAYQTVQAKITGIKSTIGNTITVTPAGAQGFQGGGNPLTDDQMATIRGLPNVTQVDEVLLDRLTPTTDTNLASAVDAGTLGNRFGGQSRRAFGGDANGRPAASAQPATFTVPIQMNGLSNPASLTTSPSKLTSGALFDGTSTENVAIVGTGLATKNSLSVDSTFTAYGTTVKVVGIYDAGNTFANAGIYVPLKTAQTLSSQANNVSTATITVNTIDNVSSAVSAIQSKIGTDKADVVSNQDQASQAIAPLENIKTISLFSLIGALIAGAIITLLTMMMIVRERRREIGVLKAIGASNVSVVTQFISEAMVLTLMGSIVGIIGGALLSNPILQALVSSSTGPSGGATGGARAAAGDIGRIAQLGGGIQSAARTLHATVGTDLLLYGLAAAFLVAIIGSALPAFLIAKVRPAEAMRAE